MESYLYFVSSEYGGDYLYGMATAIYNDEMGCYFLTANHLVKNEQSNIAVTNWSYSRSVDKVLSAEVVYKSEEDDVLILRSTGDDPIDCNYVEIGSVQLEPKDQIYGFGNPINGYGTVSEGIVSGFWKLPKNEKVVVVSDLASMAGFSGGAIFRVVDRKFSGMILGEPKDRQGDSFTYILDANTLRSHMQKSGILESLVDLN